MHVRLHEHWCIITSGTSSLGGAWSAVAPPRGGVRAWSPWMLLRAGGGDENVRQGPWVDAPPSMAVGSGANCPPPAGTPLGTIPREGDVERLKVPVFGGGDEDTGSTVANVGILASGGGAKEASEPS